MAFQFKLWLTGCFDYLEPRNGPCTRLAMPLGRIRQISDQGSTEERLRDEAVPREGSWRWQGCLPEAILGQRPHRPSLLRAMLPRDSRTVLSIFILSTTASVWLPNS